MKNRRGLTLIEVVLASAILSMSLAGMLVCLSRCLSVMRASKKYHEAVKVLGLGDVKYPLRIDKDIEESEVYPDSEILEGYTYSREIELEDSPFDPDEDHIYLMRTKVTWQARGHDVHHDVVQYIHHIPSDK